MPSASTQPVVEVNQNGDKSIETTSSVLALAESGAADAERISTQQRPRHAALLSLLADQSRETMPGMRRFAENIDRRVLAANLTAERQGGRSHRLAVDQFMAR